MWPNQDMLLSYAWKRRKNVMKIIRINVVPIANVDLPLQVVSRLRTSDTSSVTMKTACEDCLNGYRRSNLHEGFTGSPEAD